MDVRLRALRESEFEEWLATSRAWYADDMVRHAGLPRDVADRKAETDLATLLPQGVETTGVALLAIEADGEVAGHLYFAERELNEHRVAWLYEIRIEEKRRGSGLGRRTMELLEEEVRARGLDRIELNVFGGNEIARRLYRSRGFSEKAVTMVKNL